MTTSKGTNKDIARYFVGAILGEEITDIDFLPQEYTYYHTKTNTENKKSQKVKTVRLDFVATIRTKTGEHKKILIEIQKSRRPNDLIRFRNYLAQQYKQTDMIEIKGDKLEKALPIVIIYLLGFELLGIDTIAVNISRLYTDLMLRDTAETGKRKKSSIIKKKHPFIECLTHDGYFIQIPRISKDMFVNWEKCGDLRKILSLFEQDYFVDKETKTVKKYPYTITDKNLKKMIEALEFIAVDPKIRRKMEEEYWAIQDDILWEKETTVLKTEKAELLSQNATLLNQNATKDKTIATRDKTIISQAKEIDKLRRQLGLNGTAAKQTAEQGTRPVRARNSVRPAIEN
jgi:hypothetical protein